MVVNKKLILFIFFIAVIYISLIPAAKNNYYWDEVVYLHLAENFHDGGSYTSEIDEEFRPVLFPLLISFTKDQTLIHLFELLIIIITMIILYKFVKEFYSKDIALLAPVLLTTLPLYFFWSSKILAEALLVLLIILSLYLFYRWWKYKKNSSLYFAFASSALAFLTKPLGIAVIISFVVYILFKEKLNVFKRKEYYLASLIFILMLLPWLYLNIKNFSHPIGMLLFQSGLTIVRPDYLFYFRNLTDNLGFIFILFLFGLLSIKDSVKKIGIVYSYLITYLVLVAVLIAHNPQNRFFVLALPPIIIISVIGFKNILRLFKDVSYKYFITIILIALVSVNLYNGYIEVKEDPSSTEILIESQKELKNFEKGDVLCNSIPYCYFFSKNEVIITDPINKISFPESKEDFNKLVEQEDIRYLVLDNFHVEPNYLNYIDENFNLIISKQNNYKYVKVYEVK